MRFVDFILTVNNGGRLYSDIYNKTEREGRERGREREKVVSKRVLETLMYWGRGREQRSSLY